jgi:hypothetical protein
VAAGAVWFSFFRNKPQPAVVQPEPPPPKTTAELLLGSWKEVYPEQAVRPELLYHFTKDGRHEIRVWDFIHGPAVSVGTYKLEGNTIRFEPQYQDNYREEILDRVTLIEKLTDEELILVTVTKKRCTPATAKDIAAVRDLPVDQVLAEVREEKAEPRFYIRMH